MKMDDHRSFQIMDVSQRAKRAYDNYMELSKRLHDKREVLAEVNSELTSRKYGFWLVIMALMLITGNTLGYAGSKELAEIFLDSFHVPPFVPIVIGLAISGIGIFSGDLLEPLLSERAKKSFLKKKKLGIHGNGNGNVEEMERRWMKSRALIASSVGLVAIGLNFIHAWLILEIIADKPLKLAFGVVFIHLCSL